MKKKTVEEYIEVIYTLQRNNDCVHTGEIASVIGVAPATVTEMLQKLDNKKLVNYMPYYGATLTTLGEKMAKELLQKHKTLAEFLEIIGVDSENADIDACQIEHHVSQHTMRRLNKFVEFVRASPSDPRWLEHFEHYCKTGERLRCEKS